MKTKKDLFYLRISLQYINLT